MAWFARRRISFLCAAEDEGVIARPVPARALLPDWFKRLPAVDGSALSAANNGLTVKRCLPFLEAMTTGWIIPLAATVRLEVRDGGARVEWGSEFDKVMVSRHHGFQAAGHPLAPRPPLKLHNHWAIRTPPGWSCLFTPPLNRPHPALEILSGVVDTDLYHGTVHFPFFVTGPDGLYTLEKGMPLVQVVPFRRDAAALRAEIRAERADEAAGRTRALRATRAGDGWYRKLVRAGRAAAGA